MGMRMKKYYIMVLMELILLKRFVLKDLIEIIVANMVIILYEILILI